MFDVNLNSTAVNVAIDVSVLDRVLGYACNYTPGRYPILELVGNYFIFVRASGGCSFGAGSLVSR
jgi:hypothetical protein